MGLALPLPEKSLIARIRRRLGPPTRHIIRGLGDDCAILRLPPAHDALITTDFTLENVHFRRNWHRPEIIGRRCLTRGLSDIAAMGGEPIAAFLSLALPRSLPQRWVDQFMKGFLKLATEAGISLAGGDTAHSPTAILADIVILGSVPKGRAILRSSAKPGDRIYVTGSLGGSAAAIAALRRTRKILPRDYPQHFHPTPRIALGRFLNRRRLASAMIDLSDGLSTDLAHICEESRVGAEVSVEAIPRAQVGSPKRPADLSLALHGGEDYELLFTAPPSRSIPRSILGVPVTPIGVITRGRKIVQVRRGVFSPLVARGWEHFGPTGPR